MNERRHHPVIRFLLWFVAPLDDRLRGLSLARILAVACFVYVGHEVFIHEKGLTWVDAYVMTLGLASAFGQKMLLAFINRNSFAVDGKEIRETVDITLRQIADRRAQGKEWDAEPA